MGRDGGHRTTRRVYLEYFVVASWLEHLHQHARVTGEERALQDRLRRLHRGDALPMVRHFLGCAAGAAPTGPAR